MFIILEIQKTDDNKISTIVTSHETLQSAENKYHNVLAAAAISNVPLHSCVMLNEDGYQRKVESYNHEVEVNNEN